MDIGLGTVVLVERHGMAVVLHESRWVVWWIYQCRFQWLRGRREGWMIGKISIPIFSSPANLDHPYLESLL
jgi:hypothetical protein